MAGMLSPLLDIFRIRQYFDAVTVARQWAAGIRDDAGLLDDTRRALLAFPGEKPAGPPVQPFPALSPFEVPQLHGRRLALVATGGSGALASVVGAARAIEEAGLRPSVISLCSGSALFGFPVAAGIPASEVAEFLLALSPDEYLDVDWRGLARLVPTGARGFAGLVRGERIEAVCRRLLGERTLGDLAIPAYAPIWNIEHNRLEYLGPRTHPDVPVARAVHMALALPLFIEPVELGGGYWCDGGIVDIFPVRPVLDVEERCAAAVAINGFYPPGFAGEDATGWQARAGSILYVASQVRTCQQVELARANLSRLQAAMPTAMIEPVEYEKVRGVGFYRQFLNTRDWADFMRAGRVHTRRALHSLATISTGARDTARRRAGGARSRQG